MEQNMSKTARVVGTGMIVVAAVFALTAAHPWAQGTTPAPLSKVTVSPEVAKRTLMKMQINADTAKAIADSCVEFSKTSTPPQSISIFVLGPTGDIVHAHVMDGVLPIGVETGLMKAKTALYARSSSSAVAQRFNTVDGRVIRLDLGKAAGLAYYFVGGGLPIVVEDQMIGAVGVGGGNADELCAHTALTKVLGPQPALAPAPTTPPAGRGRGGQ
jgi:uncharacterized protein GlcG (DUF336 family)